MGEVHDKKDFRKIAIKDEEYITNAKIKSGVSLEEETKGAHLSRINMILSKEVVNKKLDIDDIKNS